eukprot:scaffold7.g3729.t1
MGLAVQGGTGLSVSVDGLMAEAFGGARADGGAGLRLVHRLDRETSGVLLLATSPDAAAALGAAFRRGAARAEGADGSGGGGGGGAAAAEAGPRVRKRYWAVADCSGAGRLARAGAVDLAVSPRSGRPHSAYGDAGRARARRPAAAPGGEAALGGASAAGASAAVSAAVSRYRVLAQTGSLAWLELEPLTGRKHQLRLHCARGLGAPIVGDSRYGPARGSAAQQEVLRALRATPGAGGDGVAAAAERTALPLFLHCRSLELWRPPPGGAGRGGGRRPPLRLIADLPPPWRLLMRRLGWELPAEEH